MKKVVIDTNIYSLAMKGDKEVVDAETTDFYASILNNFKRNGTPIPTNNIWIAAVAFQNGFKLYSKDKHFNLILGLVLFNN